MTADELRLALFDPRFSWMQPSFWQRVVEAFYRLLGDDFSGETLVIMDVSYRIHRRASATEIILW